MAIVPTYKLVSAATTNANVVKAGQGTVYGIQAYNVNASARYLKFYDKATAPTVGTDTPVKTILIPGNIAGAGNNVVCNFTLQAGIAIAITSGMADADTGAVGAADVVVNIDFS